MSILNSNTLTGILGSIRKPQRNTRSPDKQQPRHNLFEDAIAMLAGTMMVSFGVLFFKQSGLMTGGTAGLALLITKIIPVSFGTVFFLLNLPFYYLAIKRMGWGFTIKTFIAIGLVSFISNHQGMVIHVDKLQPLYACIFGNILLGVGFVILFRHKSSLGGINILALYIQEKTGFKAGWLQMGVDTSILLLSLKYIGFYQLFISIVGIVIVNLIIAMNHRKDRYLA